MRSASPAPASNPRVVGNPSNRRELQPIGTFMSMIPNGPFTRNEFLDVRPDLPEAGQWAELNGGEIELFEAPDTDHGLVVSHLTSKLAPLAMNGTPVFRPTLELSSEPSTLRVPAVAYYSAPGRFDLMDADAIREVPAWVIEIASTGDRRRAVAARIAAYRAWGISLIWVIDPRDRQLVVVNESTRGQFDDASQVSAEPVAPVTFPLSDLFVEPSWWTGQGG